MGIGRILGRTAVGAGLAGTATLAWAIAETHRFQLRTATLPLLPVDADPIRVLHLSDLHMTPQQRDKQEWVRDLARLDPDLVVVTGDFLSSPYAIPSIADTLAPLLDKPGLFTLGSNDYLTPKPLNPLKYFTGPSKINKGREQLPWPDLVYLLTNAGWHDLNNRRADFDLGSLQIAARGVDDPHINLDDYSQVAGPFPASANLKIGVTHAPYLRVLTGMANDQADLILAGHTHGGQICLPGGRAIVTNCDLDVSRAKGLSSYSGDSAAEGHQSALHVSAGLGTSPYAPIRLFCPPEATLLTLTAVPTHG